MANRIHILRYLLIIRKLRSSKSATYSEIYNSLEIEYEIKGYDFSYSLRTFQRDIRDIYDIFGIEIKFSRISGFYYINESDEADTSLRAFEALDLFNAMKFAGSVSGAVIFEKRKTLGTEYMHKLLSAIQERQIISFGYQKFGEEKVSERIAEPYALKEYKNHWYLLAKEIGSDVVKSFGLDRISGIDFTHKEFEYPEGFDANEPFRNSFGIINTTGLPAEEVILSFEPEQGKQIKTMPLHESQETLIDSEKEYRIKLKICITHDFIMELLSLSDGMVVLAPDSLKKQLVGIYKKTIKNY